MQCHPAQSVQNTERTEYRAPTSTPSISSSGIFPIPSYIAQSLVRARLVNGSVLNLHDDRLANTCPHPGRRQHRSDRSSLVFCSTAPSSTLITADPSIPILVNHTQVVALSLVILFFFFWPSMPLPLPSLLVAGWALLLTSVIYLLSLLFHRTPSGPTPNEPRRPSTSQALPSLLLPLTTTHLRLLPYPARHAFRYPLLYFGLDLASLESHALSRSCDWFPGWARGWGLKLAIFGYESTAEARGMGRGRKGWSVGGISESSYLASTDAPSAASRTSELDPQPLRTRLVSVLSRQLSLTPAAVTSRLGPVYLVTMPAFVGKEGINPLSVWFCYEDAQMENGVDDIKSPKKLWAIVLEVHNTFGERHVYVLEAGRNEDPTPIG